MRFSIRKSVFEVKLKNNCIIKFLDSQHSQEELQQVDVKKLVRITENSAFNYGTDYKIIPMLVRNEFKPKVCPSCRATYNREQMTTTTIIKKSCRCKNLGLLCCCGGEEAEAVEDEILPYQPQVNVVEDPLEEPMELNQSEGSEIPAEILKLINDLEEATKNVTKFLKRKILKARPYNGARIRQEEPTGEFEQEASIPINQLTGNPLVVHSARDPPQTHRDHAAEEARPNSNTKRRRDMEKRIADLEQELEIKNSKIRKLESRDSERREFLAGYYAGQGLSNAEIFRESMMPNDNDLVDIEASINPETSDPDQPTNQVPLAKKTENCSSPKRKPQEVRFVHVQPRPCPPPPTPRDPITWLPSAHVTLPSPSRTDSLFQNLN